MDTDSATSPVTISVPSAPKILYENCRVSINVLSLCGSVKIPHKMPENWANPLVLWCWCLKMVSKQNRSRKHVEQFFFSLHFPLILFEYLAKCFSSPGLSQIFQLELAEGWLFDPYAMHSFKWKQGPVFSVVVPEQLKRDRSKRKVRLWGIAAFHIFLWNTSPEIIAPKGKCKGSWISSTKKSKDNGLIA